jgi:hypothetical protein
VVWGFLGGPRTPLDVEVGLAVYGFLRGVDTRMVGFVCFLDYGGLF